MTTFKQLERVRNFTIEDNLRKYLMTLEKRDIVELYLQLKFDKQPEQEAKPCK